MDDTAGTLDVIKSPSPRIWSKSPPVHRGQTRAIARKDLADPADEFRMVKATGNGGWECYIVRIPCFLHLSPLVYPLLPGRFSHSSLRHPLPIDYLLHNAHPFSRLLSSCPPFCSRSTKASPTKQLPHALALQLKRLPRQSNGHPSLVTREGSNCSSEGIVLSITPPSASTTGYQPQPPWSCARCDPKSLVFGPDGLTFV